MARESSSLPLVFRRIPGCPAPDHAGCKLPVQVHREAEDLGGRHSPLIWRAASMPLQVGHGDVHDDDVGLALAGQPDGLAAGGGLGHDLHAGLFLQQGAQALPHDLVIVGQQDANFA